MARPEGLEPPTTWFEARYSIQLSYGREILLPMAGQYKGKPPARQASAGAKFQPIGRTLVPGTCFEK